MEVILFLERCSIVIESVVGSKPSLGRRLLEELITSWERMVSMNG